MDFIDEIKLFSKRIETLKTQIQTEEATKTSLIMPLFRMLGYDVFNPTEFVPEFTADVGIKKGEKVDYAILQDGIPVILIEAKWCGENLDKHGSQLFRYFGTTKAKFAILTNGIEYRFFTDLDESNKMDEAPFFTLNMLDLREQSVSELKKFHKSSFDVSKVFSTAEALKYGNQIKTLLASQMDEPNEAFINYILCEVYQGRKTQAVVDKFKGVIKKSLNEFVNDLLNDRLKAAMTSMDKEDIAPSEEPPITTSTQASSAPKINTTQEELEGYAIVKTILRDIIPAGKITYKDTESYFGILYDNNTWKWICRLQVETAKKYLMLPNKPRIPITGINDLFNYANDLKEVALKHTGSTADQKPATSN